METSAPAVKTSGLSTVVNTIAAPSEAFETLRVAPTWGWACIIAIVLMLIGAYLQGPAARHAGVVQMQQAMATNSLFANIPAERKQTMLAQAGRPGVMTYLAPVIVLFIAVFFNTLLTLIGNALGKGQADFKRLWAGSMNIAVPTLGIGAVVLGIITSLRSPDSFNSTLDILRSMPSLAYVFHGSATTTAFASAISIFSLWGLFLNATMLRITAKTSPAVAYTVAVVILLLGALVAAGGTQVAHNFGMA